MNQDQKTNPNEEELTRTFNRITDSYVRERRVPPSKADAIDTFRGILNLSYYRKSAKITIFWIIVMVGFITMVHTDHARTKRQLTSLETQITQLNAYIRDRNCE